MSRPSAWGWIRFCRCASDGPTLFCFHPASGFAWQFSVLARYLSPRWSITGIQRRRDSQGPMASAASLDEVCEHHLRTLLAQQPHGLITCSGIRWAAP